MEPFRTIAKVGDIPEGQGRMYVVDGMMVGLFHLDGEYYALDNRCPHAGSSLARGWVEGEAVVCPMHHWRFSIKDGTYLDRPMPQYNAVTFPVQVVGDEIQVRLPAVSE